MSPNTLLFPLCSSPDSDDVVLNLSTLVMKKCQYCSTTCWWISLKFKYLADILDFNAKFLTKYFSLLFYLRKCLDIIRAFIIIRKILLIWSPGSVIHWGFIQPAERNKGTVTAGQTSPVVI